MYQPEFTAVAYNSKTFGIIKRVIDELRTVDRGHGGVVIESFVVIRMSMYCTTYFP
jgi:hypothetical protein